jgi:hypothetical protein
MEPDGCKAGPSYQSQLFELGLTGDRRKGNRQPHDHPAGQAGRAHGDFGPDRHRQKFAAALLASQDINCGRGFVFFDLHGDATPVLLQLLARQEQITRADLSTKVIVIEPADTEVSVGLNVLEAAGTSTASSRSRNSPSSSSSAGIWIHSAPAPKSCLETVCCCWPRTG